MITAKRQGWKILRRKFRQAERKNVPAWLTLPKALRNDGPTMGVSKNRGTPKWMVKIMENHIKMDDLGVPLFLETPIYFRLTVRDHVHIFFCSVVCNVEVAG